MNETVYLIASSPSFVRELVIAARSGGEFLLCEVSNLLYTLYSPWWRLPSHANFKHLPILP